MTASAIQTPGAHRRPLPRTVWLLSWVSFFADISGEMIYPLIPLFLISVLGSTKLQLGVIEGGAVLIVSIMTAFAGFRSDRSGKRVRWIQIGYGLPMLGKAMIALATAWGFVLGGRLLDRFGKGLRSAPRDAMIADSVTSDQRGRAFGVHRALDTAGALIGVLLSALLLWWLTGTPAQSGGGHSADAAAATPAWVYRVIFGVGAGLGLASFLLTFLVRDEDSSQNVGVKLRRDEPLTTERADSSLAEHAPAERAMEEAEIAAPSARLAPRTQATGPWLFSLPRSYWLVLAVLAMFSMANSSDVFILLRASDFGYAPSSVVLVYALFNVTYGALSYPAGALSDRFGRWRIIGAGWVVYALVYAAFGLLPISQAWAMWPLMAVYGVYMALTDGVGKALIADCAPKAHRGAAMGIFYAVTGVTTLLASLLAGMVWDRSGAAATFLTGAGFAVVALVALVGLRMVQGPTLGMEQRGE